MLTRGMLIALFEFARVIKCQSRGEWDTSGQGERGSDTLIADAAHPSSFHDSVNEGQIDLSMITNSLQL